MKKYLLRCNAVLLGIMLALSLLNKAFQYGLLYSGNPFRTYPYFLLSPGVHVCLFFVGLLLCKEESFLRAITCCIFATLVLSIRCYVCVAMYIGYLRNTLTLFPLQPTFWYQTLMLVLSFSVFTIYTICAVQTWREDKRLRKVNS